MKIPLSLCFGIAMAAFTPLATADNATYTILVHTGDRNASGTDANVSLQLFGTQTPEGANANQMLNSPDNDFETGSIHAFFVTFGKQIGQLEQLRLHHDNSGDGPGWFVKKVIVIDPVNGEVVTFPFNRWLAVDEADSLTHAKVKRENFEIWKDKYRKAIAPPSGFWEYACSGGQNCNIQYKQSLSIGNSSSTSWSKTSTQSLSATVSVGGEFKAVSASTSVTGKTEQSSTQGGTQSASQSRSQEKVCATTIDQTEYDIDTVWQWTLVTELEGQTVTAPTCIITCTPDFNYPDYKPGEKTKQCQIKAGTRTASSSKKVVKQITKRDITALRQFKKIRNAGIVGYNTEVFITKSAAECAQSCLNKSWCRSFDYGRAENKCHLQKVTATGKVKLKTNYAGNPYDHYSIKNPKPQRTAELARFSLIPNAAIPGHNKKKLKGLSAAQCAKACLKESWCLSFDLTRSNGQCHLQSSNPALAVIKTDYPNNPHDHYYLNWR